MTLEEIDRELATVRHRTVSSKSQSEYTYRYLLDLRRTLTFERPTAPAPPATPATQNFAD